MGHTSRWQFEVQLTTISSCYLVIVLLCHRVIMSSFISSLHHVSMLSCHHFCQQLETFGNIWQLLTMFGHIWQQFAIFASFWQHFAISAILFAIFGNIFNFCQLVPLSADNWKLSAIFDNILQYLAIFDNLLQYLAIFDNF